MRGEVSRYVATLFRSPRENDVRVARQLEELVVALQTCLASGAPVTWSAPRALHCYRRLLVTVLAHQAEWQRLVGAVQPQDVASELQVRAWVGGWVWIAVAAGGFAWVLTLSRARCRASGGGRCHHGAMGSGSHSRPQADVERRRGTGRRASGAVPDAAARVARQGRRAGLASAAPASTQ